jgi:hypothetical protein
MMRPPCGPLKIRPERYLYYYWHFRGHAGRFSIANFVFQSLRCIFEGYWSFRYSHLLVFENVAIFSTADNSYERKDKWYIYTFGCLWQTLSRKHYTIFDIAHGKKRPWNLQFLVALRHIIRKISIGILRNLLQNGNDIFL